MVTFAGLMIDSQLIALADGAPQARELGINHQAVPAKRARRSRDSTFVFAASDT